MRFLKAYPIATLAMASILGLASCKKAPPVEVGVATVPVQAVQEDTPKEIPKPVEDLVANFTKIYFDFDSAMLNAEGLDALTANAKILMDNTDIKVEIQGHADERGTTDYNLALGQKRADTVQKYIIAEGVSPQRLTTISYGEERPLDPSHTEIAWSKNRRAEFRISWGRGKVAGTTD